MAEKMVSFKAVFDEYSKLGKARQEDVGHKESQVRDKLMEIVDAVGIEGSLLRKGEKFNSPLEIPESAVGFLVKVLDWHTSTEAKSLRKAKFLEVPVKTKEWLIKGFIDYLKNRGYDIKVIEHQRQCMEHRMKCSLQRNLDKLSATLNSIHSHICKLDRLQGSHFTDEDQILFADFADKKVTELCRYLDDIAAYLDDGRSEEIYEAAIEDFNNSSDAEIMERQLRQEQVYHAISNDEQYKKLEKECDALISKEDFVKNKQPRYKQIVNEMQKIADGYEKEIFGDIMPDEPEPHFFFKPPQVALAEAIAYKKEADEQRKIMLSRTPLSEKEQECIKKFFAEKGIDIDKEIAELEEGDDDDV